MTLGHLSSRTTLSSQLPAATGHIEHLGLTWTSNHQQHHHANKTSTIPKLDFNKSETSQASTSLCGVKAAALIRTIQSSAAHFTFILFLQLLLHFSFDV